MSRLISYIISVLVCLTIFIVVLNLPSIGLSEPSSLFTLCWLALAVIVIIAHLRKANWPVLFSKDSRQQSEQRKLQYDVSKIEQRDGIRRTGNK